MKVNNAVEIGNLLNTVKDALGSDEAFTRESLLDQSGLSVEEVLGILERLAKNADNEATQLRAVELTLKLQGFMDRENAEKDIRLIFMDTEGKETDIINMLTQGAVNGTGALLEGAG